MKIIDAEWEKRNLGIEACEIIIENGEIIKEFFENATWSEKEYIVVKFPVCMIEFANKLCDNGFYFIEAAVSCHYDIRKEYSLSSVQKRFFDNCRYEIMNNDDLEELHINLENILFETDRIALDPFFSPQQANQRYWGWVNDEIERGSEIYKIVYKERTAGFFGIKGSDIKPFAFLGGIYKPFQNTGIGSIMNYMEIEAAREKGACELHSAFSTNNRGAFAVHMSMGYILDDVQYIFVKHSCKKS